MPGMIPAATARLSIPTIRLRSMDGETVEQKNGRATVRATVRGDSLDIVANCDSLEAQLISYERELQRMQEEKEEKTKEAEALPTIFHLNSFLYGLMAGFIIILILKNK